MDLQTKDVVKHLIVLNIAVVLELTLNSLHLAKILMQIALGRPEQRTGERLNVNITRVALWL